MDSAAAFAGACFVKITILGTGALAGLFGTLLSPYAEIRLLGTWQPAIQAINRDGLRLERPGGNLVTRLPATDRWEVCADTDFAIVLVKSYQTQIAANQAARILRKDGVAVSLQNGLGNCDVLSAAVGPERAAGGITTMGATVIAPGVVCFGGDGITWFERHTRIAPLFDLFLKAGLQADITDDLPALQWGKLVINSGMNTLTALLHIQNEGLIRNEATRALYLDIIQETASIAKSIGINLPYQDAIAMAIDVATRTGANRSSMLQDIENGRQTEIDSITLPIIQAAKQAGVPCPHNEMMYRMIRAEEGSRS
jgi:2-dehydropantoate 2-reductase